MALRFIGALGIGALYMACNTLMAEYVQPRTVHGIKHVTDGSDCRLYCCNVISWRNYSRLWLARFILPDRSTCFR